MKEIRVETIKVSELKKNFGNPRKIKKVKKDELERSLEEYGDFGLILIDENNNIIAGNQRVEILKDKDENTEVLCKRLIGYSEAELKAINIKDNTHAGDWDMDMLAEWTADISLDLGLDMESTKDPDERKIQDMEPIRYEKYDYVLIACRNELDYLDLTRRLGIEDKKTLITKTRKIKARAIWYDEMKAQITEKGGVI